MPNQPLPPRNEGIPPRDTPPKDTAPKDTPPKEPPPEPYLATLRNIGKVSTGGLAAVTAVLGVFGIREGIPQRVLRDQPVASLIAFLLIGLAILLAALSIFLFDEKHPRIEAFGPAKRQEDATGRKSFRATLLFFLLVFASLFVIVLSALILAGWLEEVAFWPGQRLVLAASASALIAWPLSVIWSASGTDAQAAASRTRRMIVTSGVYFAAGLLLVGELAVTSPGLSQRPQIAASLEGNVLTTTVKGENVGTNRTYAFVVKLIPDSTEASAATKGKNPPPHATDAAKRILSLQQWHTGADAAGKAEFTAKTVLPAGQSGRLLVLAVPSERVIIQSSSESKDRNPVSPFYQAFKQGLQLLRVRQTVDLQGLNECPGVHTIIACASIMHRSQATTQLTDVMVTKGSPTEQRELKFKVTAHDLASGQQVQVVVTVAGNKRVTIYDGLMSGDQDGKLEGQNVTAQLPLGCARICLNARILKGPTDRRKGATCPAAKNTVGMASVWLRMA